MRDVGIVDYFPRRRPRGGDVLPAYVGVRETYHWRGELVPADSAWGHCSDPVEVCHVAGDWGLNRSGSDFVLLDHPDWVGHVDCDPDVPGVLNGLGKFIYLGRTALLKWAGDDSAHPANALHRNTRNGCCGSGDSRNCPDAVLEELFLSGVWGDILVVHRLHGSRDADLSLEIWASYEIPRLGNHHGNNLRTGVRGGHRVDDCCGRVRPV